MDHDDQSANSDKESSEAAQPSNRLDRLREARHQPMTPRNFIVAGGISGVFTALVFNTLFAAIGLVTTGWELTLGLIVLGGAVGFYFGMNTVAGGVVTGILSGVYMFARILLALVLLVSEMIVALFSGSG